MHETECRLFKPQREDRLRPIPGKSVLTKESQTIAGLDTIHETLDSGARQFEMSLLSISPQG
jgi:hypothetical protein